RRRRTSPPCRRDCSRAHRSGGALGARAWSVRSPVRQCGDVSRRALHGTAAGTRGGAWRAADPRAATAAGRHDDMHERTSMTATADTQRVLETHARQLAETHVLATRGRGERRARVRLPDVAGWLAQSRAALIDPAPELAKAAEWLLDNEYLIARATRQVRDEIGSAHV